MKVIPRDILNKIMHPGAAQDVLIALDTAGFVIVPRKLTPEMLQAGQGWDGIPAIWERMVAEATKP